MESIIIKSKRKIDGAPTKFFRYLYHKINLKNRLVSITGARGVGKTTLLLQIGKLQQTDNALYVALDDLFFSENSLYSLAEKFRQTGGELLLLDEVHKYPDWSRELKLIYDDFDDLKVIFTSSSILEVYKGESDLSRRALNYNLKELSLREYLLFKEEIDLPVLALDEIIANHTTIAPDIAKKIRPIKYYNEYIQTGAYPYYEGDKNEYYQRILNTINLIMDIDIQSVEGIDYANVSKFKRLLYILASNVPFTPNISKLAKKININRNLLIYALQLLERAELIHTLVKKNKSISALSKPEKIWLHNTNLNYLLSENTPDTGNIRETFFLQHLSVNHLLSLPEKGDFLVNNKYIFEVGGKNKSKKQITGIQDAFVVKDDIETGAMNIIPLWLFGLLY
ncbi:MAG: AAA family ATPase [Bacteroidota bacterium]